MKDAARITAHSWALAAEATLVVPLRLARLARGGEAASQEAALMVAEKVEAHSALVKAWQQGDLGTGALAQSGGAVKHYLGYVRANRKRLMGG
jgi:hypothetical protein